jgi:8-oxo-dGTP pyrophosphatase MutT (NUDIX family)
MQPSRNGVYIAVWWDGRILIVENSYRRVLTFPCGGKRSHETPLEGAIRELQEEVGIVVDAERFKPLSDFVLYHDNIHDHIYPFELQFENEPQIKVDNREVTTARFEHPEEALAMELSDVSMHILESYEKFGGVDSRR